MEGQEQNPANSTAMGPAPQLGDPVALHGCMVTRLHELNELGGGKGGDGSNIQHRTPNIEHPTSNIEPGTRTDTDGHGRAWADVENWKFEI